LLYDESFHQALEFLEGENVKRWGRTPRLAELMGHPFFFAGYRGQKGVSWFWYVERLIRLWFIYDYT